LLELPPQKGLKMKKWFKLLIASVVTGASNAGLAVLGISGANAAGVDIPALNFKQLGVMCLSGAIVGLLAYLKQSPVPPDSGNTSKFYRGTLPLLALWFSACLFAAGCGTTGTIGTSYDPTTGDTIGSVSLGSSNVTVTATGGANSITGQPLPITVAVTFKDPPSPAVLSVLADAGAIQTRGQSWLIAIPDLNEPYSPQFIALRAALAEGATVAKGP